MLRTFVLREGQHAQSLWAFLRANWRAMADSGRPLQIVVTEYRKARSSEQNRRSWALLNQISAEAWIDGKQFSADAWHEYAKRKFIGVEETPGGGSVGISTTTLSVQDFATYMTRVEVYAAQELGLEVML